MKWLSVAVVLFGGKDKLAKQGTDVRTSTPEEFGAYIGEEIAKWAGVIRKAGLHAQ